jgi:hypothetical protein
MLASLAEAERDITCVEGQITLQRVRIEQLRQLGNSRPGAGQAFLARLQERLQMHRERRRHALPDWDA